MSKYTYTQVEHLSDLDITGATQYYLFEEGVGHKKLELEKMKRCSIYGFESMIADKTIFTREEKPWFECIPEKGVLCRVDNTYVVRIIGVDISEGVSMYDDCGNTFNETSVTPLTNQEIMEFLQEE
jgi:hypothetical protein